MSDQEDNMEIKVLDNISIKTVSILAPAISCANEIRIAVAFVSGNGLAQLMPAMQKALEAGAYLEFLVGMDTRATDPDALKNLYALSCETQRVSLFCFVNRSGSAIYHPKMYLLTENQITTAIIGSSNLTRKGLTTNVEANLMIKDAVDSEIISELHATYYRLRHKQDRVIPDEEFIDLFSDLCQKEKLLEKRMARDTEIRELKSLYLRKADILPRPKPRRADLIGWLKLVYEALPEGQFTNQEIYEYENEFRRKYPHNLNIRAKIRQQLQILHKMGFIDHLGNGIWKKTI